MPCESYQNGRKADASDIGFLCKNGSLVLLSDALERKVELAVQGKLPDDIAAKLMVRIEVCHLFMSSKMLESNTAAYAVRALQSKT